MKKKLQIFSKTLKKDRRFLIMCLPAIVFFLIFAYLPMPGIYVAFVKFDYAKGIFGSKFVGFDNLKFITMSGKLGMLVRNTILYNIAFIATGTILQILIALLFNELTSKLFRKYAQSFMILPNFISYVLVGVFSFAIFNNTNGILNMILQALGRQPINVYEKAAAW